MLDNKYQVPEASKVMKALWTAAGGDPYLLQRTTYSDQVKYSCLGGIVFATGLMAGLSGGYAFYTIFEPRGSALDNPIHISTVFMAIIFGIFWGLMIFNLDRFIVAATGKGDGTEKITWDELKGAIPRIIMGCIIAISISKPIEIRMFKTEIDNRLYEKQLEVQKEFEKKTTANFEERLKVVENDLGNLEVKRKDIIDRIKKAEQAYEDNLMGKANGVIAGNGPLSKALNGQIASLKNELSRFEELNKQKFEQADKKKKEILIEKDKALSSNEKVAKGLDGLLERIKIAHEVAGFWITTFVTLLFLAIELTPIFFKLMLTKTPYDYLAENRDDLIRAYNGIEVKYDFYEDKKGIERHLVINHEADLKIFEKIKESEIQKELTDYAINKFKEHEKIKINENPSDYIQNVKTDEREV
ncbi:DUF4407 domain-containing protein [Chishuiella sp.]|uniref:DUF4407 domain-containing protein n=1 Tax=Chishuiella sp. TaxID=1969467 RepID=UPI0028ADE5F7|nr:DUF4407 domain-containing protein [Chishuiella sp.]